MEVMQTGSSFRGEKDEQASIRGNPAGSGGSPRPRPGRSVCRGARVAVKPADIKTARQRVGLSREAFARTFGLSPATLRKWENGEREPTGAARILLTIISREPEAALRAIR